LVSAHQYAKVYAEQPHGALRYFWVEDDSNRNESVRQSRYAVSILNVGVGAAKSVTSRWSLEIDVMIKKVNELAREASLPISAELDSADESVRFLWPDRAVGTHLIANQIARYHGNLLPASLDRVGIKLEVPAVYLVLASLQVALGLATRREVADVDEWASFSGATVSLTYIDVLAQAHVKNFRVALALLSAGHKDEAHNAEQFPTYMQFLVAVDDV
jgi:hypothetical protein